MSTITSHQMIKRALTGQERRFLFPPTSHISLVVRLRGSISEMRLKSAVTKMLVTFPQFAVRMEEHDEGEYWITEEDSAEVPVKVFQRESENDWMRVLNNEHKIPLRPTRGPLTRFILVKGTDVSELVVFCHHSISDGRSLEYALREVMLHLADPNRDSPVFPATPPLNPDIIPEEVTIGRIGSWMIGRINRKWMKERILFDEEDLVNLWEAFWKNSEYCIELLEFDEDETRRLIEISRENGVTLNSTILISFVKSRIDAVGDYGRKINVATAVDARTKLRVDCSDSVGFYAGGSFAPFEYNQEISLWENIQRYHKSVTKHLTDNKIFESGNSHFYLDQTLLDAILFEYLGNLVEPHQSRYTKIMEFLSRPKGIVTKFTNRMGSNLPDLISTNLGVLGIPDGESELQVERVFFTPSSGLKMELVLGVATAGNKLTITLNYYKGHIDGERIAKIRDKAEEILRSLASKTSYIE